MFDEFVKFVTIIILVFIWISLFIIVRFLLMKDTSRQEHNEKYLLQIFYLVEGKILYKKRAFKIDLGDSSKDLCKDVSLGQNTIRALKEKIEVPTNEIISMALEDGSDECAEYICSIYNTKIITLYKELCVSLAQVTNKTTENILRKRLDVVDAMLQKEKECVEKIIRRHKEEESYKNKIIDELKQVQSDSRRQSELENAKDFCPFNILEQMNVLEQEEAPEGRSVVDTKPLIYDLSKQLEPSECYDFLSEMEKLVHQEDGKEKVQIWWNELSDEEKEIQRSMPNFDEAKFAEILGIDIN